MSESNTEKAFYGGLKRIASDALRDDFLQRYEDEIVPLKELLEEMEELGCFDQPGPNDCKPDRIEEDEAKYD